MSLRSSTQSRRTARQLFLEQLEARDLFYIKWLSQPGNGFTCACDTAANVQQQDGLRYDSLGNPHPIVTQDVTFGSGATSATSIQATLYFGSLSPVTFYYDPASIVPDEPLRIALQ